MKSVYEVKTKKMIDNFEILKSSFKWEMDSIKHLVALNYTLKDKIVNADEIKDVKVYLKKETGMFSPFKGTMMFALCGLLSATYDEPINVLQQMIDNEKTMKSVGFKNSTYLPTALYALASVYDGNDVEGFARKGFEIYQEMKKNHPFLTSGDDYALALLLASTNNNPDILEEHYTALHKRGFNKSNGLQMMSHIMSFNNLSVEKSADRCKQIYQALKENKLKVFQDYYPAIGLMALLNDDDNEIISDLIDVSKYISQQKKYKWLGKGMHIMMAAALISTEYVNGVEGEVVTTALTVSIQAIITAQQVAMIAAITASTAGASAAT